MDRVAENSLIKSCNVCYGDNMDDNLSELINRWLKRFEEWIEQTEENYDTLHPLSAHSASGPIICKYDLLFLLDYAEKRNVNIDKQKKEFKNNPTKVTALKNKKGKTYSNKLLSELNYFTVKYNKTVRSFLELDPIDLETYNDLDGKDIIEYLLMEIKKDRDVRDLEYKILEADKILKNKYLDNIDVILKNARLEKPFFPDNFWWRHPSKIFKEKRAGQFVIKTGGV